MTNTDYTRAIDSIAWENYLRDEHSARDMYLIVTSRAHEEYLTGPWPDRDSYEITERQAWLTYYQAGRGAWQRYRAAMEMPPPPPPGTGMPNRRFSVSGPGWPDVPRNPTGPTFHPADEEHA